MAIPESRLSVAGATAQVLNRLDFIKTNESSKFNTILNIPDKLINTNLTEITNKLDIDPTKIYSAIDSMGFSKQLTALKKQELSLSTADVMNKANSLLGQSIGAKKMIGTLFEDCPYDGTNLNYLYGLLIGLAPALANQQNCSAGLISKLTDMFAGDTTPDMIGKSLMGMVDNIKNGKGESFLKDLNLNAEAIQLGSNLLNVNTAITKIVGKSALDTSKDPVGAFNTVTANMDMSNTVFSTSEKLFNIAKKNSLAKYPQIPSQVTKVVNKVSYSDLLSAKSYVSNKVSNLFI